MATGPPAPGRRPRSWLAAHALLAPAVILVFGVVGYPLVWEVWVSLTNFSTTSSTPPTFVGLANYAALWADPEFARALGTTIVYFVVTVLAKLALGLAMALVLAQPFRGRAVVFLAVFLPWVYPGGVTAIAWYWMINPPLLTAYSTLLAYAKQAVDALLGAGAWAFGSVALFNIWRGASFTAVFLLAGLNAVPTELFEYARLDTASAWQRFVAVTLPLLRPYVALAVFLTAMSASADLANVWMLTGGRVVFPVLGTQAYWLGIQAGRFAEAAARSLVLVPVLALGLLVLFRSFDRGEEAEA